MTTGESATHLRNPPCFIQTPCKAGVPSAGHSSEALTAYRTDTAINTSATINFTEVKIKEELGLRRKG